MASADVNYASALGSPTSAAANDGAAAGHDFNTDLTGNENTLLDGVVDTNGTLAVDNQTSDKLLWIDEAAALKTYLVAMAGRAEGGDPTPIEKAYSDALADATLADKIREADAGLQYSTDQINSAHTYVIDTSGDAKDLKTTQASVERTFVDAVAPIMATRNTDYAAGQSGRATATASDENAWRTNTAAAWATYQADDFTARAPAVAGMQMREPTPYYGTQSTLATARRDWWDTQQGDYATWISDVNDAETAHAGSQAAAITDRAAALSAAGLAHSNAPG
ncbi:MAG: hypothetical protein R3C99_16385 [Pirellulaceae bacterium]